VCGCSSGGGELSALFVLSVLSLFVSTSLTREREEGEGDDGVGWRATGADTFWY
jgi:hypothetical protein